MKRTLTVDLYEAVVTYDAEQNPVKTWALRHPLVYSGDPVYDGASVVSDGTKKVKANIWPASLSQDKLELYGFTGKQAMEMYFDHDADVVVGTRVYDGSTYYDVRAVNVWPKHSEAILEPV